MLAKFLPVACAATTLVALMLISNQIEASQPQQQQKQQTHVLARKSIVFDLKTPKVFYCPQEKPSDLDKMIVKAQPLEKLCEFEGKSRPKGEPSDCYNDVDETEFACEEKRRFKIRLDLASEGSDSGSSQKTDDLEHTLAKSATVGLSKKKPSSNKAKKN